MLTDPNTPNLPEQTLDQVPDDSERQYQTITLCMSIILTCFVFLAGFFQSDFYLARNAPPKPQFSEPVMIQPTVTPVVNIEIQPVASESGRFLMNNEATNSMEPKN